MKRFLLLSFLIISITSFSLAQEKAQDDKKNKFSQWYIEPAVRYGTYIPFVERHNYLAESHQYNFDLHFGYQLNCRYNINGREEFTRSEWEPFKKKTYIFLSEAPGFLQTNTKRNGEISGEPGYYFSNTFRVGVSRHFHPVFRYDVGLDFCYTGETKVKYLQAKDEYEAGLLNIPLCEYRPINSMHVAASAMFEILYNKVAFCIGVSYYLYHGIYNGTEEKKSWALSGTSPFESQYLPSAYTNYYERLGFKYYFGKKGNQFVGAFMKVHQASIDYIEWTYGINLDVFR